MNSIHHVELCENPIQILTEDKQIFFDECNKQLVTVSPLGISCTSLEGERRGKWKFYKVNKQGVRNAKFTSDMKCLAIQISPIEIEFIDLEDGNSFIQSFNTKKKNEVSILYFCWAYANAFLVVMTDGISLYQFIQSSKKGMKQLTYQKCPIGWHHYSPSHHIVLISSNVSSSLSPNISVVPIYIKSNKFLKMPQFDVNTNGIPLTPQELVVSKLYDAIYCIHVHSNSKKLVLYQITIESVTHKANLDLLTPGTCYVHVVDNLLLVHNIESKVSIMFDIKTQKVLDGFPFASPLPLSAASYEAAELTKTKNNPDQTPVAPVIYSQSWSFLLPNFILDKTAGLCWSVGINSDGLVQSTSDRARMTKFLLRRTIPNTKEILLREVFTMVEEHVSLSVLALVFDALNSVLAAKEVPEKAIDSSFPISHYSFLSLSSEGPKLGDTAENTQSENSDGISLARFSSGISSPPPANKSNLLSPQNDNNNPQVTITQNEMYSKVFVQVEERKGPALDKKYMVGVVTEYMRSLNFHHISVSQFLYELLINFLVQNKRWNQLYQILQYHVVNDSVHIACQLLSLESIYPPIYQLALDMMKRLGAYDQIIEILISKNLIYAALRFLKSHSNAVRVVPQRMLEAAVQLQDNTMFFHVFKYFEANNKLVGCEKYVQLAKVYFSVNKGPRVVLN